MRPEDRAIVDGYVAGDPECHRQVDRWICEVTRSRSLFLGADQEDVAQEVRRRLLVVFRRGSFLGESSLRTYVWRAAQHAALNVLRTRRRRPASPLDEAPEPAAVDDPGDALARAERRSLAESVLAALGEECRRLFALTVFEELPYREVAARLSMTEANVKVRALRCRRKALEIYRAGGRRA
jgi:RNA polymerase sigma-70 factor (ECF subfamily)